MFFLTRIKPEPPSFGKGIRLAIYQNDGGPVGTHEAIGHYLSIMDGVVKEAKKFNAQVVSFPELYLTGYAVSPEEVCLLSQEFNSNYLKEVGLIAEKYQIAIVCPYPEKSVIDGNIHFFDSIALFSGEGRLLKNYRKTHLWGPDESKIYSPGHQFCDENGPYSIHEINGFRVGLLNCYEAEFGELSRLMALKGAQLVIIPTAADVWTLLSTGERTKMAYPDVSVNLIPAHAYENIMFIAYCNRSGIETRLNGEGKKVEIGSYLGNSVIAGPHGDIVLKPRNEETLLIADCIPSDYGPTHPENTNYLRDRQPSLYGGLSVNEGV
jgi:predicted amidohydrolase